MAKSQDKKTGKSSKKSGKKQPDSNQPAFRTIPEPQWTLTRAAGTTIAPPERSGRPLEIEDLYHIVTVGDVSVSPDGDRAVAAVTTLNRDANKYNVALWMFPLDGGAPRRLTGGNWADSSPRWSPDGETIAFTSNRDGKAPQLWLLPVNGGEARKITDLDNGVSSLSWAPDSRRIAFTSKVNPEGFDPERDVRVITSARYKFDGQGFLDDKISHIWTIDTSEESPEPRQLTSGPHPHESPAWSPNAREIAFVANRDDDWDISRTSDIWTIPASGGDARKLTNGKGSFGNPAWSPDGTTLAFSGIAQVDLDAKDNHIFLLPAGGGDLRELCPAFGRSLGSGLRWHPDGTTLLSGTADRGSDYVVRIDAETGAAERLTAANRSVLAFAPVPGSDAIVAAIADATTPAELSLVTADKETRLSSFNEAWLGGVAIPAPEELWIDSGDERIQGWLIRPAGNTPESAGVPLVLHIHGGPHGQVGPAFSHELQMYAAKGFAIAFINARGSSGRDEAFTKAVVAKWGVADTPDQLAAVEHVLALGGIDPERVGVTGGSYGGYMTNWLLGTTDRFKVGVTDRSISNMASMYGTDDIALVSLDPELGAPWENFELYWNLSPLKHVANIDVPLLIIHSENDYRCPMEQAEQLFTALKRLRKTVEFVRFQGESHGLSRNGGPAHRVERLERTLGWFERYL